MNTQLETLFATHKKIALQFSGGRDSLAMLLLLRAHWSKLTVYFCDSGDIFPETARLVKEVAGLVPNFVRVAGVPQTQLPSDVLTTKELLPQLYGTSFIQAREECCAKTLMEPMHRQMLADGITLIFRGQRSSDFPQAYSGTVDGRTVFFPVFSWSAEDVEEYIQSAGFKVPRYYSEGMTSAPDCMHCTAWLEHGAVRYLTKFYPKTARIVRERLIRIHALISPSFELLGA